MKTFFLILFISGLAITGLISCVAGPASEIPPALAGQLSAPQKTMRRFRSDQELTNYLKELAEKQQRIHRRGEVSNAAATPSSLASAEASAQPGTDKKDESITNVQHAGVDEGGIVKLHGNQLVVLRRGRLFTVAIGDNSLQPISAVDAFGPEIDPRNTWYDEMLVSNDTIAVIGYSYERGGTEVGLFQIDDAGRLTYRSTYHLRSNDYYSSRNYASRLIGNKLIFYTPSYLYLGSLNPFETFPAVRKWHKGAKDSEFQRIVSSTRVYRSEGPSDDSSSGNDATTLHTVTVCDLADGGFKCDATAVLGPPGRVFYVSPDSVYVWVSTWVRDENRRRNQSMVYRMPLDGSGPSALKVSGSPVDQFSFLQSNDEYLNVLVRADAAGDAMWESENVSGNVALMRVPLSSFSDGSEAVPRFRYRTLSKPNGYTFQNRFVGDYLLYGTGNGWNSPEGQDRYSIHAIPWAGGDQTELRLAHSVDRIEQMGKDAVVIGTDGGDLHFTSLRLSDSPEVVSDYVRKGASQGELRSHGFFYKSDSENSGVLGLPISVPGRPGYRHLFEDSAAVLFLRNDSLHFQEVGELHARPERAANDGCRASCVDWYGNARPLFVRG
ncbi:MAG TPA: beta-propeller domain-containing protein, partial [Pyrinomonadaceae bacterium]|nr:beta-propeller domain-containing protein [Pyrinomonadaceae bacterium]